VFLFQSKQQHTFSDRDWSPDVCSSDLNRGVAPSAIQWRSSDKGVVRVSPLGVITAVGGGRAEIVASGFLQEIRVPITVHKAVARSEERRVGRQYLSKCCNETRDKD